VTNFLAHWLYIIILLKMCIFIKDCVCMILNNKYYTNAAFI